MRTKIQLCFWILFLSVCSVAKAQREPVYIDALIGDSIKVGKKVVVKDSSFYDPVMKPTIKQTYSINNIISLRINEDVTNVMPDSFTLAVKVKIIYTAPDTLSDSISEKTLTINYNKNKSYDNKSIFYFNSAHYVEVSVLQITSTYADTSVTLPLALLENRMVIQRDYDMSCTGDVIQTIEQDTSTVSSYGELKLRWTPNHVSHMYDVEWTYLDQSAVDSNRYSTGGHLDPNKIFRNNATRITTKADTCMIPLLYDGEGVLVYRIRGVQIDPSGELDNTNWNTDSDTTSAHWKYHFMGHERGLNWQASTSFAEEGKRKSVVQYFDGSLRARQVVTRDNTVQTTVVAETLYDKQGRPVIQVMPAPTLSTLIHYTPLFNVKDMNGAEYDKGTYDTLTSSADYCQVHEDSMSVSSGASQYYSALNPLKDQGFHKFIPSAHGYAFTQTQYSQDNTGRIYAQGGVDSAFVLGSGRETKYYYFAAKQNELDALFGTEVGDETHYQKNMVRDANGQYSVSYVDMHGRTIATALAGKVPTSLDTLSSWRDSVQTDQLLNKTSNVINGNSVDFSTSIFMTREDDVSLHYSMAKNGFSLKDCKDSSVCYSCLYDLTITVTGDCPGCVSGKSDTTVRLSNFPLWRIDSTCNLAVPIDTVVNLHLKEGGYNITKTLSISKLGMDKYRDSVYLLRNTCSSYDSIYRRQMKVIKDSLTCSADTLNESSYLRYRDIMMADVYPLVGQYGHYQDTASCFSIFNKASSTRYYYQIAADSSCYKDENGNCDLVVNDQGDSVKPEQLSPDEFIAKFKDSWLSTLVYVHPEYKRLVQYERFATSLAYDDDFERTTTYTAAVTKGYLNPTSSSVAPASNFTGTPGDPLYGYPFASGARSQIEDSLFKIKQWSDGSYITAWGLATAYVKCPTTSNQIDSNCLKIWNQSSNVFNTSCGGDLDMAWSVFRTLYLKQKWAWIDKFVHDSAGISDGALCKAVFPTVDQILAENGYTSYDKQSNQSIASDSAHAFYVSNCNAYVDQWKQQLGSCYSDAEKDTLVKYLTQVCVAGADSLHPFGSSTISPISTYQYQSFAQVFTHYNSIWSIDSSLCNSYRIDKPQPYTIQQAFTVSQQVYGKPDSCTCSKINALYTQYQAFSSAFTSFSDYVQHTQGTTIAEATLDSLRNLCNGTLTCNFLPNPITIPPALQCGASGVCVNCAQFKTAYDAFTTKFPTITPAMDETDSTQQIKNKIFSNYLNNWFGYTKTTQDYLTFKDACDSAHLLTRAATDTSHTCSNYQKLVDRFKYDYINRIWTETKQDYDSNGWNVTYWTMNNGGWTHDKRYKMSDAVQGGVWKHPDNDTVHPRINFNYNKIFCVNNGFSLEARLKFPRDSAKKMIYLRAGGDTNRYGTVIFELFQNSGFYDYSKVYGETYGRNYSIFPYVFELNAVPPDFVNYDGYYTKWSDSSLVMDLNDWRVFKIQEKNGHVNLFEDGVLKESIAAKYQTLKTAGRFDFTENGYGLQIDWIKMYDENDSLRMTEDFNDSIWTQNPFDSTCFNNWQDLLTNEVNATLSTNYTYSQIVSTFASCGVVVPDPNYTGPTLCGTSDALNEIVDLKAHPPCQDSTDFAVMAATQLNQIYQDSVIGNFNEAYTKKCLSVSGLESFTISKPVSEYHYTLYYYDQAGNLIKTIPPEGVHPNRDATWLAQVKIKRASGDVQVPSHLLPTVYRYNSLNQVATQTTPDGGLSKFWYDRLGRLAVSQNAQQADENNYSYTKYDLLGRIVEVGQKLQPQGMSQDVSRSVTGLSTWLSYMNYDGDHQPKMVTLTNYDDPSDYQSVYQDFTPFRQKAYTLRNRVSRTRLFDTYGFTMTVSGTDTTYTAQGNQFTSALEYSYDIHGNVDSMLNISGPMWWTMGYYYGGNAYKLIAYKYDLISGKVNEVHYQPSNFVRTYGDEFYHRYEYDAENRLTDVYTTDNKAFINQPGLEEHEAHYEYYKHGPLARMVLGQQQVQGVDYAYTLQGWLKGVNSTSMNPDKDMGADGNTSSANKYVARDEYGFNLNYFTGEYSAISGNLPFPGHSGFMSTGYRPLYNGNISSMAVNIKKFSQPQLYNYKYDQLNRITKMDVFRGLDETNNNWNSLAGVDDYRERVSYDANGNIMSYVRHGYGSNIPMDSLTYHYWDKTQNNRLEHINDGVTSTAYTSDLKNQSDYNYQYNKIGNLISDGAGGVGWSKWNVYGKITNLYLNKSGAEDVTELDYLYDPNGNRLQKDMHYGNSSIKNAAHEWYVRDAQGNVMALYTETNLYGQSGQAPLYLSEQYIYGSSRIGVVRRSQNMDSLKAYPVSASLIGDTYLYQEQRGNKFFELSNHLGNVLVTVSDKKYGHVNGSSYDYYNADVVNATDYYPFGMEMPNRTYSAGNSYRYGFNGKENDNEVKGEGNQQDYGARIYDTRIGRFLSVDPLTPDYPNYTPYSFAGNKPIEAKDLDGFEEWMAQQGFATKARAELDLRYPHYSGGEIKTYNPSWTERWRNSKGFLSKLSYDIVNGFYTTGQQMTATMRGSDYVNNLGGNAYRAHGAADENERTKNFVDAASTLIPSAEAESAGNKLLTRILESRGSKTIVREVENEVTEQVVARYTVDAKKFDYFFGKVVTGAEHNVQRSAQNLKDLTTLGIKNQNDLIKVFDEAIERGATVTSKTNQYGTTIVKSVDVGEKGSIEVSFFYKGGDLNKTPTISTIIPKIHK